MSKAFKKMIREKEEEKLFAQQKLADAEESSSEEEVEAFNPFSGFGNVAGGDSSSEDESKQEEDDQEVAENKENTEKGAEEEEAVVSQEDDAAKEGKDGKSKLEQDIEDMTIKAAPKKKKKKNKRGKKKKKKVVDEESDGWDNGFGGDGDDDHTLADLMMSTQSKFLEHLFNSHPHYSKISFFSKFCIGSKTSLQITQNAILTKLQTPQSSERKISTTTEN